MEKNIEPVNSVQKDATENVVEELKQEAENEEEKISRFIYAEETEMINYFFKTKYGLLFLNIIPLLSLSIIFAAFLNYPSIKKFTLQHKLVIFMPIIFLCGFIVWKLPRYQLRNLVEIKKDDNQTEFDRAKEIFKLKDDTRKTLIQILGGAIVILGLFFTLRTFEINRSGQMAERFLATTELLRKEDTESKIVALKSLKYFCEDSFEKSDDIREILARFIFNTSKSKQVIYSDQADNAQVQIKFKKAKKQDEVLTAAGIILSGSCGKNLSDTNIYNLEGANFSELKYSTPADFNKAFLFDSYFNNSELLNVDFIDSMVENGNFIETTIKLVSFKGANLHKANFANSRITSAGFKDANLSSAVFTNVVFQDVDFERADFTGANLDNVEFIRCKLLYALNLTQAQLQKAKVLNATVPPHYVNREGINIINEPGATPSLRNIFFPFE